MQKDYQPQLLSTPKEKAELLATTGVDYCIVLDFTPEIARLTACEFMEDILKKKLNVASLVIIVQKDSMIIINMVLKLVWKYYAQRRASSMMSM